MKKLYQIIGIFLIAVMLFPILGCSMISKNKVADKWEYEVDYSDKFMEVLSQQFGIDLDIDAEIVCTYVLNLHKDGSFELYADDDKFMESFDDFLPKYIDAYLEYLYETAERQGYTKEDVDAEIYAEYGKDTRSALEEVLDQYLDYMVISKSIIEEGYYQVRDDVLLLSEDEDDFRDAEEWEFKLTGDRLTIRSIDNQSDDNADQFEKLGLECPMKFNR